MTLKGKRVLVCGAGGFIGGHMVKNLLSSDAASLRAVDIRPRTERHQVFPEAENLVLDLSEKRNCLQAVNGNAVVFQLAADMGGMGFIESNKALRDGMARTYHWIEREMTQSSRPLHRAGVLECYATA